MCAKDIYSKHLPTVFKWVYDYKFDSCLFR